MRTRSATVCFHAPKCGLIHETCRFDHGNRIFRDHVGFKHGYLGIVDFPQDEHVDVPLYHGFDLTHEDHGDTGDTYTTMAPKTDYNILCFLGTHFCTNKLICVICTEFVSEFSMLSRSTQKLV